MFFYGNLNKPKTPINIWNWNGTKQYLKHYDQKLFLCLMAERGNRQDKWQAEKELPLCEKALAFWEKHPNFVKEDAQRGVEELNRNWKSR